MTVNQVVEVLQELAPSQYQETWDNSGLQVGNIDQECTGVMLALDCTEEILQEAIQKKCNLIVTHHPLIFKGIKKISSETYIERILWLAIQKDLVIFALHTNLDKIEQGVSYKMLEKLGLKNAKTLHVTAELDHKVLGFGAMASLETAVETKEFLEKIKQTFSCHTLKYAQFNKKQSITHVAVCGGSGIGLLPMAMAQKADIFITADAKYHDFFDAQDQLLLVDIGHYESEICSLEIIYEHLIKKFSIFAVCRTNFNTNPIGYL